MLFADDVKLLSEEIHLSQKLLSKVQNEAAKIGLRINAKKRESMERHTTEMEHNLVFWEPTCGKRNRGGQPITYTDCLKEDTGLTNTDEIRTAMMARYEWEKRAKLG